MLFVPGTARARGLFVLNLPQLNMREQTDKIYFVMGYVFSVFCEKQNLILVVPWVFCRRGQKQV